MPEIINSTPVPLVVNPSLGVQSSGANVLYGSDISQIDKDLIFDGLKNLYKKKVRILNVIYSNQYMIDSRSFHLKLHRNILISGPHHFLRAILKQSQWY